jgi:hypothetical protein
LKSQVNLRSIPSSVDHFDRLTLLAFPAPLAFQANQHFCRSEDRYEAGIMINEHPATIMASRLYLPAMLGKQLTDALRILQSVLLQLSLSYSWFAAHSPIQRF